MKNQGHHSSIKILGNGKVVRGFLKENQQQVRVYGRQEGALDLRNFHASPKNIIIYCCSIDEKRYFELNSLAPDRLLVAEPNLAVLDDQRVLEEIRKNPRKIQGVASLEIVCHVH